MKCGVVRIYKKYYVLREGFCRCAESTGLDKKSYAAAN